MKKLAKECPSFFSGLKVPWFSPEGYVKMRAAAADRENLCDTFEEFEQNAIAHFDQAVADGHSTEKVMIDADALIAWCVAKNRPLDATARYMFTAITVMEMDDRAGHA